MTGLCGWFGNTSGSHVSETLLAAMAARLPLSGPNKFHQGGDVACAVAGGDVHIHTSGLITAIVGQPYWMAPNLQKLAETHGHAHALAEAYRLRGDRFFGELHGAFTFIVADPSDNRLIAAIDRIGQHTLYYSANAEAIVFGTTTVSVQNHPAAHSSVALQSIFDYTYFHMIPSPGCVYEGQKKLAGGEYIEYRDGQLNTSRYWNPMFFEATEQSLGVLAEELKSTILRSVERLSENQLVGAFLSGGLDSSTVSGMLAKLHPGKAKTFSIGFPVNDYDEVTYARAASEHFGTQQHEYYVTPADVTELVVKNVAGAYDEPFGNSSALPVYFCAKLAKENNVNRLLAGDGGDELFAGNRRYATQGLFELYKRVPASLRSHVLEPCLGALPGIARVPLLRKAYSYIQQAKIPLPERLETYNFLHRHTSQEIFNGEFLASIDVESPLRLLRELYDTPKSASPLNRMLYLDWHRTLHDNDLVKVNRMCQLAGIEVAYPLLDDEVVEFSLKIPSILKLKGQRLRWFYKKAMEDFLPSAIIKKSKHGFGLPFGIWTRSEPELRTLAYDSIADLKKRNFFREDFLNNAVEMHRTGHASYYGELIWILMMLEQWFQAHSNT